MLYILAVFWYCWLLRRHQNNDPTTGNINYRIGDTGGVVVLCWRCGRTMGNIMRRLT